MIRLGYLGDYRSYDLNHANNLLIVRKPPVKIPPNFTHVHQLSPSLDLFSQAQEWKRKLGDKKNWFYLYEEQFLKEMHQRDDMVRALRKLERRIHEGQHINLFCYCKEKEYCHRLFIGRELESRGHDVFWGAKGSSTQLELFN